MSLTIEELRANAKDLLQKNGWSYNMFERTTHMASELGEVAKEVIKLKYAKSPEKQEAVRKALSYELYDLIWNAVALAEALGLDLEAGLVEKMTSNKTRVFPSHE